MYENYNYALKMELNITAFIW